MDLTPLVTDTARDPTGLRPGAGRALRHRREGPDPPAAAAGRPLEEIHADLDSPPGRSRRRRVAAAPARRPRTSVRWPSSWRRRSRCRCATASRSPPTLSAGRGGEVPRPPPAHALRPRGDPKTGLSWPPTATWSCCRTRAGRFDSGGEFYPFRNEAADGFDTVEWAAALPYSDGKVGMFGGSYVGATQMLAAMAKPPHLVAIQPYVTASEYYEGWTYQGGALMQWFASSWSSGLAVDTLRRKTDRAIARPRTGWRRRPSRLPPARPARGGRASRPTSRDWMRRTRRATSTGARRAVSDHYGEMTVKALHQAGWHDIFSARLDRELHRACARRRPRRRRAPASACMVGPWAHASTSPEGKVGDVVVRQGRRRRQRPTCSWSGRTSR